MKRRKFLFSGSSVVGIGGLGIVGYNSVYSVPDTIRFCVHQTEDITHYQKKRSLDVQYPKKFVKDIIEEIFNSVFEPEFEVIDGSYYVPDEIVELDKNVQNVQDSPSQALRKLSNWILNNWSQSSDVTGHLLLAHHSNENQYSNGVASPALISSCCEVVDRHGIVWTDSKRFWGESDKRVIGHEIGHMLGLQHSHGGNVRKDYRSLMLTRRHSEIFNRNIFGERIVSGGEPTSIINNNISEKNFRI